MKIYGNRKLSRVVTPVNALKFFLRSSVQFCSISFVRYKCIYVFCLNDLVLFLNFPQGFVEKSTPTGRIHVSDWHLDKDSLILFEGLWRVCCCSFVHSLCIFFCYMPSFCFYFCFCLSHAFTLKACLNSLSVIQDPI